MALFGVSPRFYGEIARTAEQHGFESVWMPEHLVLPVDIPPTYLYSESGYPPITADTPMYDAWVVLSAIGAVTETIRLATNVYILPLRHPIVTARAITTLDRLTNGRVTLGIGVGWLEEEFEVVDQPFHDRGKRTDEIMELLRKLWRDDVIEHHTEHYDFGPIKFQPKPIQKQGIPIEVGGTSKPALRRAGRLGDGWVETGTKDFDELASRIAVIQAARKEAGRENLPWGGACRRRAPGGGGPPAAARPGAPRRAAELGVTRVVSGAPANNARVTKEDVMEWIKRYSDEVIAKV
jgi:probable F420-dependent oxidoreductase